MACACEGCGHSVVVASIASYRACRCADPEAEEKFKKVKDAYDVLSDPDTRATYDKGGMEAVKLKEAVDNMDPQIFIEAFLHSGLGARLVMVSTVVCCCIVLLIFPILLIVKVDNAPPWSWPAVFVPLFVWGGCISMCCCGFATKGDPSGSNEAGRITTMQRISAALSPLLIVVFLALLADMLEKGHNNNFVAVCIPAFLYEALGLLNTVQNLSPAAYQARQGVYCP